MRKLILISALLLASVSAQAGETRSLSLAGIPTANTTAVANGSTATEAPKPIAQVSAQLAQAATSANDAAPIQVQAPAPVQAQTPAATPTTTAPAATTTTATTTETKPTTATTETSKTVKKARRESDEAKARRIAARYGVYW